MADIAARDGEIGGEAYEVFVAYAGADIAFASVVHEALSVGCRAFMARRSPRGSGVFPREIERAHRASGATLVLVSRSYLEAHYLDDEVQAAIGRLREGHQLFVVLLDESEIPYGLRNIDVWRLADLGGPTPLAARVLYELGLGPGGAEASDLPPTDNPYEPNRPASGVGFVGRARLLRDLQGALERGVTVSLVGHRRIGKTSILQTWSERLQAQRRTTRLVSGLGRDGVDCGRFVQAITGEEAPATGDGAADALQAWAEREGLPGLPPVVLVDEIDGLVSRFPYRFFERIRGLEQRVACVFASRHPLDLLFKQEGQASPWDNEQTVHWVGLLDAPSAAELVGRGVGVFGPTGAAAMHEWAGRHPYYLQLLGWHLVRDAAEGLPAEQCLDGFLAAAAPRLRQLWADLSENERAAVRGQSDVPRLVAADLRSGGVWTEHNRAFGRVLSEHLLVSK